MEIESIRGVGGRSLVKFKGMDAPELARTLTGSRVFLRRSDFPIPGEGEYYWADLVGLRVRAGDQDLGIVEEIVGTAAFDLLVVRGTKPAGSGREEHLIPFTQATLKDVRLAEGLILVGPPEEWETVRGKPEPDGNEPQKGRGDEEANRSPGEGRNIRRRAKSKQEG
jgi:16S rRNA processing protein RimM